MSPSTATSSTSSSRGEHGHPHARPRPAPARRRRHRPRAQAAGVERSPSCYGDEPGPRSSTSTTGVWAGVLPAPRTCPDYRLEVTLRRPAPSPSTTRTASCPTLGEIDLHLINEGRHEQLWEVLGAHVHRYDDAARRRRHRHVVRRVGADAHAACGSRATSTAGTAASTRCASSAPRACGSCSCPTSAPAPATSSTILGADGAVAREGRPDGVPHRGPARRPSSVVFESTYTWGDDDVDGPARAAGTPLQRADVGLRGAPRLVAQARRRGATYAELADELVAYLHRPRLHPRRVPAGDGAPVRRLVGLPGHVVLRPDRAVRRPRRLPATSSTGCTRPASA